MNEKQRRAWYVGFDAGAMGLGLPFDEPKDACKDGFREGYAERKALSELRVKEAELVAGLGDPEWVRKQILSIQAACWHIWSEAERIPAPPEGGGRGWKRTCLKCGQVQTTNKQKEVVTRNMVPDFEEARP